MRKGISLVNILRFLFALALFLEFRAMPAYAAPAGNPVIEMTVVHRGKVRMELFPKEAPKTVAHILRLINKKFYDGIKIHRVEPGFVVQAGDPTQREMPFGDAKLQNENIPFEINKHTHEEGTLGIALTAPKSDTGTSQFFINLAPNHHLDGNYCVFGKVIKGMDVVKKIQRGDKIERIVQVKNQKKS
jgi:cyclophilin family peptidyl-prolyl cis-trans isomerase